MKASKGFKGNSSLYTWLCVIAKNEWLNRCKRYGRETPSELIPESLAGESSSVEQKNVMEQEDSFLIHKALHELNEPYKEVFSLRVFGELPFSEIASLFSKIESWARVTHHRARKMIIEKLERDAKYGN